MTRASPTRVVNDKGHYYQTGDSVSRAADWQSADPARVKAHLFLLTESIGMRSMYRTVRSLDTCPHLGTNRSSMSDSAIMRQLRRNISTASLFSSPLAEENHLTPYGANALAISVQMELAQSSLGSAAARAKVQRRRRSKSTSARSARRLIILIGSA